MLDEWLVAVRTRLLFILGVIGISFLSFVAHLIAVMEVLSSTALAKYSAPASVIPALHPKLYNMTTLIIIMV